MEKTALTTAELIELLNIQPNTNSSKKLRIYQHTPAYPKCKYQKLTNGLEIIKAESFEAIESIKEDWEILLDKYNLSNVYITPDFFLRLFNSRANNAKPNIILFKKGNSPKAMIVGWEKETKIDCKIGYLKTKTPKLKTFEIEIGGLITNDTVESEKILENYLCGLLEKKEVELISIDHLSATNPCWNTLKEKIAVKRKAVYRDSVKWKAKIIDKNTGEILGLFSKKTEQKFRRKDKKFRKFFNENIKFKEISSLDEVDYFIENANIIDNNSYHKAMGISVKKDFHYYNMFHSMAEGKYFRGYLLFANNKPIAYYYGVLYDGMFYAFNTSYNNEYRQLSPGIFLLRRMIELFIKENVAVIHFGYGDSPYKRMFGNEVVEEATFRIYSSGIKAQFAQLLDKTTLTTTYKLSEFLDKLHLLNKIKKTWRNKLLHKNVA
jgi:hypothetical protein